MNSSHSPSVLSLFSGVVLTIRTERHWKKLSRGTVQSPSLEHFKTQLDKAQPCFMDAPLEQPPSILLSQQLLTSLSPFSPPCKSSTPEGQRAQQPALMQEERADTLLRSLLPLCSSSRVNLKHRWELQSKDIFLMPHFHCKICNRLPEIAQQPWGQLISRPWSWL